MPNRRTFLSSALAAPVLGPLAAEGEAAPPPDAPLFDLRKAEKVPACGDLASRRRVRHRPE